MAKHDLISQFSVSGKTYFFNRGRARNDSEYLAINTIYGQGSRERVVIFPDHMVKFYRAFLDSMEEITGLRPGNSKISEPGCGQIPDTCPDCGDTDAAYSVEVLEHSWRVVCSNCRELIFDSDPETDG